MCNTNCCCNGLNKETLKKLSLVFILINTILSLIAIFIRAAKTKRYEEALVLLEQRNNGTYNATLYNCYLDGIFHDEIYCDSEGKRLSKPDENVSNQSLFKNWNAVELFLNVSRLIITGIFLIFFYFAIKKYEDGENNLLSYSIAILGLLVADSGICILIRALTIGTNHNIGLYEIGNQNEFESYIATNYIIDIIEIVLNCVVVCFVIRIQRPEPQVVIVNQSPPQPQPHTQPIPQRVNIQMTYVVRQTEITTNRYIHPVDTYGGP
jgi:hypothetical protein